MRGPRLTPALVLLVLPLFLGFSSVEEGHTSPLTDLLGKTINFIILFGGLAYLLAKPLRKLLAEMGLAVKNTIQETAKAKTEAEEKLAALLARMQGLEQEARAIKDEGEKEGERERARILSLARKESERIRAFAAQEVETLTRSARAELNAHAAELAVSLARARIERRLTPELHSHLIDDSISRLDSLYEKPHSG
jgi:F-type H+-transporting ATPase subunit b